MAPRVPAAEPLGGDDERLLIEAAQADPRRFAELYERNFDRVYAFVARRAGGRDAAEDLTAEVFHHALAHLGRFEWRGVPFAAWLLQIAPNAVADRGSARRGSAASRRRRRRTTAGSPTTTAAPCWPGWWSAPRGSAPRRAGALRRGAEHSRDRPRAGRSEGAIKQLQFRALQSLRARIGEQS